MAEVGKGGNVASLMAIQGFRIASGFAVNVLLMRGLGVDGFGIYGWVTILVNLAGFAASMGMDRLLKRELARDPDAADRWVYTGLAASGLLSLGAGALIVLLAWLLDGRPVVVIASALAALSLGLGALSQMPLSWFHGVSRMGLGVRPNLLGRVVLVAGTAAFLWLHLDVKWVFFAQVLDGGLVFLMLMWSYRKLRGPSQHRVTLEDVQGLLRSSTSFGLATFFTAVWLNVDVLLLGHFRDDTEVGVYRAAVMLISLFPVVAETLNTAVFPRMARHLGQPAAAGEELNFVVRVLLAFSVPAAVGGLLTGEALLVFLGGEPYRASALAFLIMAPLIPLRFLNNGFGMALTALDRQDDRTRGVFLGAAVNVSANLWALPRYGAAGAAAVTLACEVVLLAWLTARVWTAVSGLRVLNSLLRVGAPALVMAAALHLAANTHVLVQITLGAAVFAVAGLGTGAWHPNDLRRLRRI